MFSFLLHMFHQWTRCTVRRLDANIYIYFPMELSFSITPCILKSLYQIGLTSPCVCVSSFYISFVPFLILVQCLFLEGLVEDTPLLPSPQQGSSINKSTAPHCAIMGKNKLRQVSSFNSHCLMTLCAHIPMQLHVYLTKKECV